MRYQQLIEDLGNVALGVLAILYGDSNFTPQEKAKMSPVAAVVLDFRNDLLGQG